MSRNGFSRAELDAVQIISAIDNPANPRCHGSLAVHRNGTFHCIARCEGASLRFHTDDAPTPCHLLDLAHEDRLCGRCRSSSR